MAFDLSHADDLETTGGWRLVRRTLGIASFGVNLVDIPPGGHIPEHDGTGRDHEGLFFRVEGTGTLVIDGDEHAAAKGTFARLAPVPRRTVRNHGDEPVRVLIASAPRSSGYEPMGWA